MTAKTASRRWSPALVLGIAATVVLAGFGLVMSRPDIAALGLPLGLWSGLALTRRVDRVATEVTLQAAQGAPGDIALLTEVTVASGAEIAELVIVQAERRTRQVIIPGSGMHVRSRSKALHSGPVVSVQASARPLSMDTALLGTSTDVVALTRSVAPTELAVPVLPLAPRLTGLHGIHEGRRPGQGGNFRDIHPFVPGDELRRVDWRATARLARRPGELLVRRTNTMSDGSVVIAMDTAEDLGTVAATWGSGDLERSGETSLDLSRQAARSIAASAIESGDRVALHVLVHGGRSLRSGAGSRHLARVEAAIAATGQAGQDARFRRTPPVPHGSVIFVLSTFFDGAAAEIALMWRASGHRVVAVDILPVLDRSRLSKEQQLALRTVLAEREDVFHDLGNAAIDTLAWRGDVAAVMRTTARGRR